MCKEALRDMSRKCEDLQKQYEVLLGYHVNGRSNIRFNDDGTVDICKGEHERHEPCDWKKYKEV